LGVGEVEIVWRERVQEFIREIGYGHVSCTVLYIDSANCMRLIIVREAGAVGLLLLYQSGARYSPEPVRGRSYTNFSKDQNF
jgi:hypothetical protein